MMIMVICCWNIRWSSPANQIRRRLFRAYCRTYVVDVIGRCWKGTC